MTGTVVRLTDARARAQAICTSKPTAPLPLPTRLPTLKLNLKSESVTWVRAQSYSLVSDTDVRATSVIDIVSRITDTSNLNVQKSKLDRTQLYKIGGASTTISCTGELEQVTVSQFYVRPLTAAP